jgi:hypothetical protein
MLTKLTLATELFHAPDEKAFADIIIEGHRETWPIRCSRFRLWLRRKYYEATGEAPSAGEINSAGRLLRCEKHADLRGRRRGRRPVPGAHAAASTPSISTDKSVLKSGERPRSVASRGGKSRTLD